MIRNKVELEDVCARLKADGVAALDTEFVWRNTNRPLLSLVQLGADDGTSWIVDCLTGLDPAPLADLIYDDGVVKILHDAHQDLDHLFHWTGAKPRRVFDTQLAAAFAGYPAKRSLQKLLFEAVDVGLPKTETVTDWSQRPLTDAQVSYALDDVRYLGALRRRLLEKCGELGTLAWEEEEQGAYDNPALYGDADPDEVWKRIKCGRHRLGGRGFAALRALAAVREVTAREWNLPRTWLGKDDSLVEMAMALPTDPRRVRISHRLRNRGQVEMLSGFYADAIQGALDLPEDELPDDPHPQYVHEVLAAADDALDFLRAKAEEVHVDASVIANRATVTAWVDNPEDQSNPLASGWRYEVAGREIQEKFAVA